MRLNELRNALLQKQRANPDLGFGNQLGSDGERLINKDGSYNIVRQGMYAWTPYQSLVEMSWSRFLGLILLVFVLINAAFAAMFMLVGVEAISGHPANNNWLDNFAYAFFFSVQTFTTVGYGAMSPEGVPANALAGLDALTGLIAAALATGLFFARFAKPRAEIVFSNVALITPYKDTVLPCLQLRLANLRSNKLINLSATVTFTWLEERNREKIRRYQQLELERPGVTLFPLNWTLVHFIDEKSPLYGWSPDDFRRFDAEVLVFIQGHDETYSQTVHAGSSYTAAELRWNVKFAPMYHSENGQTVLHLNRIHDTVRL